MAELVASPQQRAFGLAKRDTLPRYCRECDVRFACHGGCPKDRFIRTPEGEPGLNYLCAGYKAFFHHIDEPMRTMSELLRQGRAPSELMGARTRHGTREIQRGGGQGWAKRPLSRVAADARSSIATGRQPDRTSELVGSLPCLRPDRMSSYDAPS